MKLKDLQYAIRSIFKKGKLTIINNGYKHKEIEPGEWHFGAVNKEVLQENGQWTEFLPEEERQSGRLVESMGCTGYGTNNALEMIIKKKYGLTVNLSDRSLNKASNTSRSGNNINNVLDTVRKSFGAVAESIWTWDRDTFTWDMYYSSMPKTVYDVGKNWLNFNELNYENVSLNPTMMMDALKYSPLIVAGYAWYLENGLYCSYGRANHCFTVVGYVEGQYWLAFDSYSPFLKKLAWDYKFGACKCITLTVKEPVKDYSLGVSDAQVEINNLMSKGYKYIQRPESRGEIYRLTSEGLVFIENQNDIATDISNNIQEIPEGEDKQKMVNAIIRSLVADKVLTGVSEELFNKLQ